MELSELKRLVDLEQLLCSLGYQKDKTKSTRKIPVYCDKAERLIVREGNDCKIYYKAGSSEQGTIIDFLKNRPEYLSGSSTLNIFERIKEYLCKFAQIQNITTEPWNNSITNETPFILNEETYYIPQKKEIDSVNFSYLKFREISQETLVSPVFNNIGLTKKSGYNNIAFPLFDSEEKIKGIDYRYLLKGQSVKAFISGSDKRCSIGISSDKREGINELFLCESPIDAMSHYELYRARQQNIQYIYFCGSLTKGQIQNFLLYYQKLNSPNITLGFDNDIQGNLMGQAFTTSLLCSILSNSPIPFSYAGKDRFAFIFMENAEENSQRIQELLKEVDDIQFQKNNQSFSFSFAKEKNIINLVNKRLQLAIPKVTLAIPVTKDWNDDLKIKHQTNQYIEREKKILKLKN